jgi:DNA polymerase III epsilon subunit-like protein
MSSYPILTPVPAWYRRALVFDVETTGLIPKPNPAIACPPRLNECPYVIQLSYVVYNLVSNRVEETYNAYISIPEEIEILPLITNLTGITRETVREQGIPIQDALEKFCLAYMRCDVVVAHNLQFDSGMIAIETARNVDNIEDTTMAANLTSLFTPSFNTKQSIDLYCTMLATVDLYGDPVMTAEKTTYVQVNGETVPKIIKPRLQYKKYPKLSALHAALFGTVPENLHNSLVDTLVCLRCFLKIRCCFELPDRNFARMLSPRQCCV